MGHPVRPKPGAPLFGLAPCGVLPATRVATSAVRSYRTISPLPAFAGGIFSVPLSFESPRPGVTRRTALRSSDFPPAFAPFGATVGQPTRGSPHEPTSLIGLSAVAPQSGAKAGDRLTGCEQLIVLSKPAQLELRTSSPGRREGHQIRAGGWRGVAADRQEPSGQCQRRAREEPPISRRCPERSGTAPASCTSCCEACRSLRRSLKCSSRSPATWRPGTRAPHCP